MNYRIFSGQRFEKTHLPGTFSHLRNVNPTLSLHNRRKAFPRVIEETLPSPKQTDLGVSYQTTNYQTLCRLQLKKSTFCSGIY